MMSFSLISRRSYRSTLSDPSSLRVEARPPSLRSVPASAWQRLVFWLMAPSALDAAPPLNRLPAVRAEFVQCLADIAAADAPQLKARIGRTHSLRELWHLRAEVYRLVGLHHSQAEAERRLTVLNKHFPTRAPRSGFATL